MGEEATLAETPCKREIDGHFPSEQRGTLRLTASEVTHVHLEGKQQHYPIGTVLRVEKHDRRRRWKKARPCVELLLANGQKLTFACRNDTKRQAFVAAAQKAIADHATVLGQQSLLMGTGASLLVLPEDLVEGLTTLQQTLEAADAWTETEREAVRDALEKSRGVYEKRIDEARAHCEDLRKLRSDELADFSRLYDAMYIILTKKPGFADFNTQANRCASDAPQQKPRQETQQLDELYEAGAVSACAPFASLLDAAQQRLPNAEVSVAPLKRMPRTIQKSMLRADAARRGNVDDILDVVRGMVICATMSELGDALTFFSEANHGWKIVRVKNRFADGAQTSGGWADCLLNVVRADDPHQHVCEVQLVHQDMLLLRKRLGGHEAYNSYRTADELLLVLNEKDVFAPVRWAVGMLKGLGVVTPRTPDLPRIGAGASLKADTQKALDSAHSALRLGGAAPSLVIAAYTCTHDAEQVRKRLRELVPPDTPFVGVSSCRGVVANGKWHSSSKSKALGLWAISDDRGDYGVVHIQDLGDPDDARRVIDAQQVVADKVTAATAGRPMPQFVLCFSALGFSEAVLKGIKSVVGAVPVFGGTAADNELKEPYEWSQFSSEGGVSQNGVVLVLGWSSVEVACYMSSGFQPTEQKGVATKTDGSTILEIDGRPAMTVYDEWTRASGEVVVGLTTGSIDTTTEDIAGELRPIGVPLDDDDKEFRVLHPLSVDSAAGSLTVGGWVAEGTNLTLLAAEAETLVNNICEVSSALVKSDAQKRLGVDASGAVEECLGAFMIFCGGLVKACVEINQCVGCTR